MGTSVYPGALDDFAEASPPYLADDDTTGRDHPARHDDLEAAMEAVQGELGTDPAGGSATVKARLDALDATVAALTGGAIRQSETVSTTTAFSRASTSYGTWTGLEITGFTPASTANSILLRANVCVGTTAAGVGLYVALADGTTVIAETFVSAVSNTYYSTCALEFLFSPASTAARTLRVRGRTTNASYAITSPADITCTLTAMEVVG